jgi:hypothetical protein
VTIQNVREARHKLKYYDYLRRTREYFWRMRRMENENESKRTFEMVVVKTLLVGCTTAKSVL